METLLGILEIVWEVVYDHPESLGGMLLVVILIRWLMRRVPWWVWLFAKVSLIVGPVVSVELAYWYYYPQLMDILNPVGQTKVNGWIKDYLWMRLGVYGFALALLGGITERAWWRRKEPKTAFTTRALFSVVRVLLRIVFRSTRGMFRAGRTVVRSVRQPRKTVKEVTQPV